MVTLFVHHRKLNPVQNHLLRVYERVGFPGNADYLEPPTWVAICSGMLHQAGDVQGLVTLRGGNDTPQFASMVNEGSYGSHVRILGSVMDATKNEWNELLRQLDPPEEIQVEVYLGGYVDPSELQGSFAWVNSPAELPGADVNAPPDYSLFKGQEVIARLQMSTGCFFRCNFCTVPQEVKEVKASSIFSQVYSWKDLKVRYVYLDDKTFGQAKNWKALGAVEQAIKRDHPEFEGFIIQTTVGELYQKYDKFFDMGVRYAEIGVEVPDDRFLSAMNKPYRRAALDKLMVAQAQRIQGVDNVIHIIPNILFAVPGDDYQATLEWLDEHRYIISHINPFILSFYEEAKNPEAMVRGAHEVGKDDDENRYDRSWLTPQEVEACGRALAEAMRIVEDSWGL